MKNVAGNTDIVPVGMGTGLLFGARFESLSSSDKRTYNIDNGTKISEVEEGLFRDMGLKKGTIITRVNDEKINSSEDIRKATNNKEQSLKSIEGIAADGRLFSYRFGY